jgi:hypothetical protein
VKAHVAACLSVTFLILYACFAVNASAPVRFLKLQPKFTMRPTRDFHATVWVERDALNRTLRIEAVGADFYRSSDVQLDGEQAARVFEFWWPTFIPCGEYRWTATTFTQSGSVLARATDRSAVCVAAEIP